MTDPREREEPYFYAHRTDMARPYLEEAVRDDVDDEYVSVSADHLRALLDPWEPIETAPKNGATLLVTWWILGRWNYTLCSWSQMTSNHPFMWRGISTNEPVQFTHWTTLPLPPRTP